MKQILKVVVLLAGVLGVAMALKKEVPAMKRYIKIERM